MNFVYIENSRVSSLAIDLSNKIGLALAGNVLERKIYIAGIGESGLSVAYELIQALKHNKVSKNFDFNLRGIEKSKCNSPGSFEWFIPAISQDTTPCILPLNETKELSSDTNFVCILVDGVVRSGKTLLSAYRALREISCRFSHSNNRSLIFSYAIAVNPTSSIIPTWFGTLYSPDKYVVLSRDEGTPNVSILEVTTKPTASEPVPVKYPPVVLREPTLVDSDFTVQHPPSMNRYTKIDRYFDHQTKSRKVYVIEIFGQSVGYVSFHIGGRTLWLDYLLIDDKKNEDLKREGIHAGAALVRFVVSYANSLNCTKIGAWAITKKLKFYLDRGFEETSKEHIKFSDSDTDEEYALIIRRLDNNRPVNS